ncbi:fungal-specific transcription factor domain-containing protein [Aspergillus cavernicola]|uniref:Fungal-specific transcription factor domain-containing protein n=1 Tax=Aspergillus cavernicola TaxID=176166 RepID=A0ABR4I9C1_9EURO
MKSCDACRRRKVKCDKSQPCSKCKTSLLKCTYEYITRPKGPQGPNACVLSALHAADEERALSEETASRNYNAAHTLEVAGGPSVDRAEPLNARHPPSGDVASGFEARRLSSELLLAHINVWAKHLFPVMPILSVNSLLPDCADPELLSPKRYALLVALCAATHIQLRLDRSPVTSGAGTNPDPSPNNLIHRHLLVTGEYLLSEALKARGSFDPIEQCCIEDVLTSFFLFESYANFNRQSHAWFYLSQAIAFAISLHMHDELSYTQLDPAEASRRRRLFWLLFVTETGFSLQQRKPVTLRSSIKKPETFSSDNSLLIYGFQNIISVFERLPAEFYNWFAGHRDHISLQAAAAFPALYQAIACPVPLLEEVSETQRADILITQQWLVGLLWIFAVKLNPQRRPNIQENHFPIDLSITVGISVLGIAHSSQQSSIDANGIGMEQKLFDVGCYAAVSQYCEPEGSSVGDYACTF